MSNYQRSARGIVRRARAELVKKAYRRQHKPYCRPKRAHATPVRLCLSACDVNRTRAEALMLCAALLLT
jgi:hypothetical protein